MFRAQFGTSLGLQLLPYIVPELGYFVNTSASVKSLDFTSVFAILAIMKLLTQQYVENRLAQAAYEYDKTIKFWVGWIDSVPGVVAQAPTLEGVRNDLAEILEERLLTSLRAGTNPKKLGSEFNHLHVKALAAA